MTFTPQKNTSKNTFLSSIIVLLFCFLLCSCSNNEANMILAKQAHNDTISQIDSTINQEVLYIPDTNHIPKNKYGNMIRYGKDLFYQTAYLIGPEGVVGKYAGNKMTCNSCHIDGGTKPFAYSLIKSHARYPQYRAREGKVLSMAERVNNCLNRPLNGKSLPLDSKEMMGFLSYIQWIGSKAPEKVLGDKALPIKIIDRAANPENGRTLYNIHCKRCHQEDGSGKLDSSNISFIYPPLWGNHSYQPGSSMHRVIMQAKWIKANMPQDLAKWDKPILTDEEAFDIAAYVNDDKIHPRPNPPTFDYPNKEEKAIDYDKGPYIDNFSEMEHKFGPFQPIIDDWKSKGMNPKY